MRIMARKSIAESFEEYARRCDAFCTCHTVPTQHPKVRFDSHHDRCGWRLAWKAWRVQAAPLLNVPEERTLGGVKVTHYDRKGRPLSSREEAHYDDYS